MASRLRDHESPPRPAMHPEGSQKMTGTQQCSRCHRHLPKTEFLPKQKKKLDAGVTVEECISCRDLRERKRISDLISDGPSAAPPAKRPQALPPMDNRPDNTVTPSQEPDHPTTVATDQVAQSIEADPPNTRETRTRRKLRGRWVRLPEDLLGIWGFQEMSAERYNALTSPPPPDAPPAPFESPEPETPWQMPLASAEPVDDTPLPPVKYFADPNDIYTPPNFTFVTTSTTFHVNRYNLTRHTNFLANIPKEVKTLDLSEDPNLIDALLQILQDGEYTTPMLRLDFHIHLATLIEKYNVKEVYRAKKLYFCPIFEKLDNALNYRNVANADLPGVLIPALITAYTHKPAIEKVRLYLLKFALGVKIIGPHHPDLRKAIDSDPGMAEDAARLRARKEPMEVHLVRNSNFNGLRGWSETARELEQRSRVKARPVAKRG